LFEVTEKSSTRKEVTRKYTFVLPVELMKQVKHAAIEDDVTISEWLTRALKERLEKR